jgi:hypothetical protein
VTLYLAARVLLFVCAALALAVARRSPPHRPLALTLCALLAADLIRWKLTPIWLTPGPYTGSLRAAFHVDQVLLVMWRWSIAACLWATLERSAAARKTSAAALCLGIGGALALACVSAYPWLRQDRLLGTAYPLIHVGSVIACMAAVGQRLVIPRRLPKGADWPALVLALGAFAQLGATYWQLDPVRFWPAGRAVSVLTYATISLVLGWQACKRTRS